MDEQVITEFKLWERGFKFVAGVDEAGRGPLAGPVVAAAVMFERGTEPFVFKDSKKLPERKRKELFFKIVNNCLSFGIGIATSEEIDKLNILNATRLAAQRAVQALKPQPEYLITDALYLPFFPKERQSNPIKGDERVFSCACASILAKVSRDFLMELIDSDYPEFEFKKHKGYPTKSHRRAIKELGATPFHRKSFKGAFVEKRALGGRANVPIPSEERLSYFKEKLQEFIRGNRHNSP